MHMQTYDPPAGTVDHYRIPELVIYVERTCSCITTAELPKGYYLMDRDLLSYEASATRMQSVYQRLGRRSVYILHTQ